ncbi:ribosomal protein S8 [Nadsonia fulvescens var. elongata DSM 6958]|uniref:Ribosomal protein S8 n=1 Tax=Nadsonia fulvescens var. elongata DSM 6958 TaxID=857566 RepID=A0A1E3PGR5_9ASCO|nr:ribosomal protein S8 [Nadsonia fulvescens var. elongata DSM 6958]
MSLVNLAHVCSHIQNCSRNRVPLAAVSMTRLHLQVCAGLYKEGFLSSIQRGDANKPDETFIPATPQNIATRKLWLGLKYDGFNPVLSKLRLISKPSHKFVLDEYQLRDLAVGKEVRKISPLAPGEAIFVKINNDDVVEIREAVAKRLGGQLLCRAS